MWSDTAFLAPQGSFSWRTANIGYHQFDYTVHRNVEVGAATVVPAGFFFLVPEVKVAGELSRDVVSLGAVARGGVGAFLFGWEDVNPLYVFGGGPMLSIGDPDLSLTVGTVAYGVGAGESELSYVVYPYVGGSARVSRVVKLNLELSPIIAGTGGENVAPSETFFGMVLYGVRFHGENIFGDVAFALPINEGWFEDVAKYMPVGIPLLSFGYSG